MNTNDSNNNGKEKRKKAAPAAPAQQTPAVVRLDLAELANQADPLVEQVTLRVFLRSYSLSPDDIIRFGVKLNKMADALGVPWLLAQDKYLGSARAFPRPLIERLYELMAGPSNWPKLIGADSPEAEAASKVKHELRSAERMTKQIGELIDEADSPALLEALVTVRDHLARQATELREKVVEVETAQPRSEAA